jgi:UrcA family protein
MSAKSALIALTVLGLAGAASAQTLSVTVRHADLDLSSPAGATVMLARIHNAAREICGESPYASDMSRRMQARACITEISNNAVAQLGAPMVTAANGGSSSVALASR